MSDRFVPLYFILSRFSRSRNAFSLPSQRICSIRCCAYDLFISRSHREFRAASRRLTSSYRSWRKVARCRVWAVRGTGSLFASPLAIFMTKSTNRPGTNDRLQYFFLQKLVQYSRICLFRFGKTLTHIIRTHREF